MLTRRFAVVYVLVFALVSFGMSGVALAAKPTIMKGCMACHNEKPDVVRGKLVNYSPKFNSIQVDVGPLVWMIRYDQNTQFKGTEDMGKVEKGKEMSVTFSGTEKEPLATTVSIKPPFEIPAEKLVSVEEMQKMVDNDMKGVTLIDSRPPDAYASGHIPGASNIPYPKLNKMREEILPEDKDTQIVFYCGGFA